MNAVEQADILNRCDKNYNLKNITTITLLIVGILTLIAASYAIHHVWQTHRLVAQALLAIPITLSVTGLSGAITYVVVYIQKKKAITQLLTYFDEFSAQAKLFIEEQLWQIQWPAKFTVYSSQLNTKVLLYQNSIQDPIMFRYHKEDGTIVEGKLETLLVKQNFLGQVILNQKYDRFLADRGIAFPLKWRLQGGWIYRLENIETPMLLYQPKDQEPIATSNKWHLVTSKAKNQVLKNIISKVLNRLD